MLSTKNQYENTGSNKTTSVGIIGLGYVGLPLAVHFAERGFCVTGIDTDQRKVDQLNQGYSYLPSIENEDISEMRSEDKFLATTRFNHVKELDAIILCLPTPVTSEQIPDLQLLKSAVQKLAPHLKKGTLIVLESTVYPGATEEIIEHTLLTYGFKAGRDYHLCYSPERVDPGNHTFNLSNTPKVLAGKTPACMGFGRELYQHLTEVVEVSSIPVAEMSKLLENTYRSVNIGFVNEMAQIAEKMSIDIWEVIDAAATKPYGFQKFTPGPGVGGHCIPVDPHYLNWKAGQFGLSSRFIELADQTNRHMPEYVMEKIEDMTAAGKKKASVLLLGAAYKPESDDIRDAPGVHIFDRLQHSEVEVCYHDPFVEKVSTSTGIYTSWEWDDTELESFDLICLITAHEYYKDKQIPERNVQILDTQGFFGYHPNITRLGGPGKNHLPEAASTVRV
ncbi:nucleotide sugar dehydrogenase [Halobacillus halophilus]|uniref:nucleotide sugar dehydrogenase n=1 Tax=Halobacillus halophilus TaxID=1570 RepID=UPI001368D7BE|nr:nucleotide sugar dehydrogenase [Halobacillus halophilus]MYL30800.1 nucleotide sugar dehydrogenase [Halobacillus halophilus]